VRPKGTVKRMDRLPRWKISWWLGRVMVSGSFLAYALIVLARRARSIGGPTGRTSDDDSAAVVQLLKEKAVLFFFCHAIGPYFWKQGR